MDDPTTAARSRRVRRAAESLRVLGSPERLRVLLILADGVHGVDEIRAELLTTQQTISYHLRFLQQGGFVVSRRAGRFVHYTLTARGEKMAAMIRTLAALFDPKVDDALDGA